MSYSVSNAVNSAIVSGYNGLQNASNNITQASSNIVAASLPQSPQDTGQLLTSVARQQIAQPGELLKGVGGGDSLTGDILTLQVGLTNAQASSKVIGVAKDVVGTLLNEIA